MMTVDAALLWVCKSLAVAASVAAATFFPLMHSSCYSFILMLTIQLQEWPFDATVKATNRSEVILIALEAVHWNTDHELIHSG